MSSSRRPVLRLGRVGNPYLTRPKEGSNRRDREGCGQVSLSPCRRGLPEGGGERTVVFHALLPETPNRRVAPGGRGTLRSQWAALWRLGADPTYAHHCAMGQSCLLLDCTNAIVEELVHHAEAFESSHRKAREPELLGLGPPFIKTRCAPGWRSTPAAARPIQPAECAWPSIAHERECAEPRPFGAPSHEAFFDPVGEHVADLLEQGGVVQYRLSGVPAFPEGPSPLHEGTDLLRDVGQEVLHELRKVSARRTHDQVKVVRGKVEGEELDAVEPHCASEYAAKDLVRLPGRTEEETSLQTPNGGEVNGRRIKHAKRSAQEVRPPTPAPSTNRAIAPRPPFEGARHLQRTPSKPVLEGSPDSLRKSPLGGCRRKVGDDVFGPVGHPVEDRRQRIQDEAGDR